MNACHKTRIFTLASFVCASLFLGSLAVQRFIFERLDPNGVPGNKENAIRWSEYYDATRGYKLLAIASILMAIWFAIAVIRHKRRVKVN